MTRQSFPGQHKFRIISGEEKQAGQQLEAVKQARQRAHTQRRVSELRKRRLKEQHDHDVISEEVIAKQAIERWDILNISKILFVKHFH